MERSIKRLLRNGAYIFCAVMLIFSIIEAAREEYPVAVAMAAAAVILLILDLAVTRQRVKGIASNVQTAVDNLSKTVSAAAPWPMAFMPASFASVVFRSASIRKKGSELTSYLKSFCPWIC